MFFNNNNFQEFLQKNSLLNLQRKYPDEIEEIFKSLNGNFNLSTSNVTIRQNFIIMDLLDKINSNMEKLANKM